MQKYERLGILQTDNLVEIPSNWDLVSDGELAMLALASGMVGGGTAFILLYLFETLTDMYGNWKTSNSGEIEGISDTSPEPFLPTPPHIVQIAKDIANAESIRTDERETERHQDSN